MLAKFEFAAKQIKRNSKFKIWKDGFHPIECLTTKMIIQKLDYIHNNPVEQEIVMSACEYKYSSARDYAGEKSDVEVILI